MKKRLIIIDGNSLMYRAFYALPPMKSTKGISTNIIYGYVNMLTKIREELKPDFMAITFDRKEPTFRHESYDLYKANRLRMPEEMAEQIPYLKKVLTALDYEILEKAGYEADDIIGTLSVHGDQKGYETLIITGDRDALQLITENVNVLITKKGISELDRFDFARLREVYTLRPDQIKDLKGLMGDSSDNIPGVPGVGEKTALELLSEYDNIENLYEHIEEIKKPKLKEKLILNREMAFMSKELATIFKEVPVEMDFLSHHGKNPDWDTLEDLYTELSMKGFVLKVKKTREDLGIVREIIKEEKHIESAESVGEDDWVSVAMDALKNPVELLDLHLNRREPIIPSSVPACVRIVKDTAPVAEQFDFFGLAEVQNAEDTDMNHMIEGHPLILNMEHYREIFKANEVHGFKIMNIDEKNYLGLNFDRVYLVDLEKGCDVARTFLEDPSTQKVGLDVKTDLVTLGGYGIVPKGILFDVILGAYVVNPLKNFMKLEYLTEEFLGSTEIGLELTWNEKVAKLLPYMEKLYQVLAGHLKRENLEEIYYGLEFPLTFILADMEMTGFKVDAGILMEIGERLDDRIKALTAEIYSHSELEFNINSPKQLGEVLFVNLGLPAVKKTKTGFSTDNEVLEDLKDKHPIIVNIIEYRRLTKLKGTYIEGLIPVIHPVTGRIHSHLSQIVAATGRLSSTDPNLQNIPVKTVEGREIRKAFVAEDSDHKLVIADYSQIELRILAHIAGDESLINAFIGNEDIHTHTASEVFNVPEAEITKTQRSRAKAVNFGIVYGISDFGLSRDIGVTRKEAKAYIETYFQRYPGVKRYMDGIVEFAKATGYVTTLLGRKRYIPEIGSRNAVQRGYGERVAMNTPIQGSAADIIKKAMIDVYRELNEKGLKSKLIMQVHDELIIEAPDAEVEIVKELLKRTMEESIHMKVPMTADVNFGSNWFESK